MARKRAILAPDAKRGGRLLPPPESGEHSYPAFGFYRTASGYGIADASKDDLADFFQAIRKKSAMTWADLHSNGRKGLGIETIKRSAINVMVPAHVTVETTIYSMRVRGRGTLQRIIGYREGNVFVVVWLDCDGSVYDHGP